MRKIITISSDIKYPVTNSVTLYQAVIILYQATLNKENYLKVRVPEVLYDYAVELYALNNCDEELITQDLKLIKQDYKQDTDLTIFLYTGGKDSLASRVEYKNITKRQKTIHIHGLNQMYPLEQGVVARHKELLNIEIDILSIKLPRLHNQMEHPVKNLLTHILSIEYYQVIPKYFSFGFINFSDAVLDGSEEGIEIAEEEEEDAELDYLLGLVPQQTKIGSPQISEVVGDGSNLSALTINVLSSSFNYEIKNTIGMPNTVDTFRLVSEIGLHTELSSCMSLTSHRDHNRSNTNNNPDYALKIDGVHILAGETAFAIEPLYTNSIEDNDIYRTGNKKSVWDLVKLFKDYSVGTIAVYNYKYGTIDELKSLDELKLQHLDKVDRVGDYECSKCFKDTERYIIQYQHLGYKYSKKFIDNCYKLLLSQMSRMENNNNIDFRYYLIKELKINKQYLTYLYKYADNKQRITKKVYRFIRGLLE